MNKPYPTSVCNNCGREAQKDKRKIHSISTWNMGTCDVCGLERPVTETRDFGYPAFKGHTKILQLR